MLNYFCRLYIFPFSQSAKKIINLCCLEDSPEKLIDGEELEAVPEDIVENEELMKETDDNFFDLAAPGKCRIDYNEIINQSVIK